jgi:glycosyltransferase involved in cell wall biosynthesis
MKVCYVLPQYYYNSAENFYHIINFLEKLGKKVELYVVIEHCDSEINIQSAQDTYVLNTKKKPLNHFYRTFKLIQIYFELYKKDVKIFFARASLTGVLPLILANRIFNFNRSKIIFWSCGQDVVPLSYFPNKRNIKRLISKILVRFVFIGINYLATGPEKMASYYHKKFNIPKNKIITLYNDISLSRFFPESEIWKSEKKQKLINSQKKVFLFVHTFNKARGVDLLPSIALILKKKNIDAVIIAIGRSGDYSYELDLSIKNNNLQDYLINFGQIENSKIQKFYQISDLFIMPSRGEGFPRVMLEAMACKCPPLAFDVGGVSEIMSKNMHQDLLVTLDDSKSFIDKAIDAISNDQLLIKLGSMSYSKVQNYSTENIVQMYINAFNKI